MVLLLQKLTIPKSSNWKTVNAKVSKIKTGNHDLIVVSKDNNPVEIDWIQFSNDT